MGYVVKLGDGARPSSSAKSPDPKEPAGRSAASTSTPAAGGSWIALNSMPVAIGAGVAILAVIAGLWFTFGRGPDVTAGTGADKQGIYAPPEVTGANPGLPGRGTAQSGTGVYAPPEVTGAGGGAGQGQGVYVPPQPPAGIAGSGPGGYAPAMSGIGGASGR
jgi:hypothetical protein